MSKLDTKRANTLSDNLELIMETSDLTVDGIAEYVSISKATVNRAILKMSNISPAIVLQLANSFGLTSNELTDKLLTRMDHIPQLKKLLDFKKKNETNFNLFKSESEKHNAQLFVKNELLEDDFFTKERKMKEIIEKLKQSERFQKEFTKAALEQSIKRILIDEEFLTVPRKSPNGKVFYYKVEKSSK
jgi:plasmid maintenance system antidote protein VapI